MRLSSHRLLVAAIFTAGLIVYRHKIDADESITFTADDISTPLVIGILYQYKPKVLIYKLFSLFCYHGVITG